MDENLMKAVTYKKRREYMEECFRKVLQQKDVFECIVIGRNRNPVKSTMNEQITLQYTGLFDQLIDKARQMIQIIDPEDDLTFMRIRTRKHEVLVAPDDFLTFLVVQDPITNR